MHRRRLLFALAASVLAGVGLGSLQLLLWPQVPPSLGRAVVAALAWGSWGGLWLGMAGFLLWELAAVVARLFGWGPRRPRPEAAMTVAGLFVAVVAAVNQEAARELLPAAHRQALGVVAALALMWAVLWLVASRWTSPRAAKALVAAWLVAVWWPWWGAQETPEQRTPSPPEGGVSLTLLEKPRRALVVVWEGADLPWLLPLMDGGMMPFLQSLWPRGSWGQLRTPRPFSRAASLTTWATGCSPVRHGVVARRAYRLPFLTGEPVSLVLKGPWPSPHQLPWRLWRRAAPPPPREPTLWEALAGMGVSSQVVGWPFPLRHSGPGREELWETGPPLDPAWEAAIGEAVRGAVGKAGSTRHAFALAAETGLRAAVAVQGSDLQVLVVHLDLPARLRPLWTGEDPGGVLPLAAQFLDSQLAELWALVGSPDAYLAVGSPYGMEPPHPWDRLLSSVGLAGSWPVSPKDSPDGFFFLYGPGVAKGVRVAGARAADVVPTLMYLLELPVARTLSGRVLLVAVDERWAASVPLRLVPAYRPGF
ncbi:MAG: alkaline phosphatase family protein [Thermoanaerobaculum sp.]